MNAARTLQGSSIRSFNQHQTDEELLGSFCVHSMELTHYTSTSLSFYATMSWITLTNSCVNPLIYALFYPWFRKTVNLIFTLRILQPHSQENKIL